MKLSEMKQVLESGRIQLTKSLGQNFLHDGNQLRRIVEAAELKKTDRVLEVGPGLGPLTELLVEQVSEVLAIEKDRRLFEFLKSRFASTGEIPSLPRIGGEGRGEEEPTNHAGHKIGGFKAPFSGSLSARPSQGERDEERQTAVTKCGHLTLLHDDALKFLQRERRDWANWKLVANLPYSVASPILVELAQAHGCPERIAVTLQLEVARRLVARVSDEDYGVLSLLMQLRYEPLSHFKIPADCFFPAPDVDSACVTLKRRSHPLLPADLHAKFERLVKLSFSQRRKMMVKLLKQDWPAEKLESAFTQLNISPQIRAEKVGLEQFVELTTLLAK